MRRRLYLMRHAEVSYFGDDGAPVDPREVPLNEEGIAQAKAVAAVLDGIELDRVVCSGLPRTLETAAIVAPARRAGVLAGAPRDPGRPALGDPGRRAPARVRPRLPRRDPERDAISPRGVDRRALRPRPSRPRAPRRRTTAGTRRWPSSTAASTARSSPTRSPASGCSSATSSRRRHASTCSTSATAASGSCEP